MKQKHNKDYAKDHAKEAKTMKQKHNKDYAKDHAKEAKNDKMKSNKKDKTKKTAQKLKKAFKDFQKKADRKNADKLKKEFQGAPTKVLHTNVTKTASKAPKKKSSSGEYSSGGYNSGGYNSGGYSSGEYSSGSNSSGSNSSAPTPTSTETPSDSDRAAAIGIGKRIYSRLQTEHKTLIDQRRSDEETSAAKAAADQKKRIAAKLEAESKAKASFASYSSAAGPEQPGALPGDNSTAAPAQGGQLGESAVDQAQQLIEALEDKEAQLGGTGRRLLDTTASEPVSEAKMQAKALKKAETAMKVADAIKATPSSKISYHLVTTGKCTDTAMQEYVQDGKECEAAAKQLKLKDVTTIKKKLATTGQNFPNGCMFKDDKLQINANKGKTAACTAKAKCVCKKSQPIDKLTGGSVVAVQANKTVAVLARTMPGTSAAQARVNRAKEVAGQAAAAVKRATGNLANLANDESAHARAQKARIAAAKATLKTRETEASSRSTVSVAAGELKAKEDTLLKDKVAEKKQADALKKDEEKLSKSTSKKAFLESTAQKAETKVIFQTFVTFLCACMTLRRHCAHPANLLPHPPECTPNPAKHCLG